MNALIRFALGLPARSQDVDEIREVLPEILDEQFHPSEEQWRRVSWFLPFEATFPELRDWIGSGRRPDQLGITYHGCPIEFDGCPLRRTSTYLSGTGEDDFLVYESLLIAGFAGQNSAARFFELVRRTFKGLGESNLRAITITDRYIHDSFGESGHGKGFARFAELLGAMGLTRRSTFTLQLYPGMQEATRIRLEEHLQVHFPGASVERHARIWFHDRLYLGLEKTGRIRGVFGPSLNGLDRGSLFLAGELDRAVLDNLGRVLNVR